MPDDDLIDEDPPQGSALPLALQVLALPLQVLALEAQRASMLARVAEIETLLGFVATSSDLSVRVAALERFVGLQP